MGQNFWVLSKNNRQHFPKIRAHRFKALIFYAGLAKAQDAHAGMEKSDMYRPEHVLNKRV